MLEFLNESTKKTRELSNLAESEEFSARDLKRYLDLNGRMIKAMEKEHTSSKMVRHMLVNSEMGRKMEREYLHILMVKNM